MADIKVQQNWLVSPNKDIEKMWYDVQIQEKKSAIAAGKRSLDELKQKIEDIQKGQVVGVKARVLMLEREVSFLEQKKQNEKIIDAEIKEK